MRDIKPKEVTMSTRHGLIVKYDPTLDKANQIANKDIRMCMGHNPCGCRATTPGPPDKFYLGVWLPNTIWTFCDALVYWADISESELRDYLYSEHPGALGVVPFFARAQEKTGKYKGNIPIARWDDRYPNPGIDHFGGKWDLGGYFDLAYSPRVNHRDIVQ
ncbi:MAG: hypothetical protein ACE5LX_02955, partial [Nitrospinota bacterium]